MTTVVTHEIMLKLIPLTAQVSVVNSEKADQDAWLNNDNTSLIDSLYNTSSNKSDSSTHHRIHQCDQLSITTAPEGYQLETQNGAVSLQEADIIALPTIQFLVTLQTQTVAVPEVMVALPRRKILPEDDDIWSNPETKTTPPPFADPFAYQRPKATAQAAITPSTAAAKIPLPNIPLQTQYSHAELNDPLGFLYPSSHYQPTDSYYAPQSPSALPQMPMQNTSHYAPLSPSMLPPTPITPMQNTSSYASSHSQANVLHDLGINEQSAVITRREYTSGKATYLEQSPVDMLDEYLRADDMQAPSPVNSLYQQPMPTIAPHAASAPMPSYYAPTIHDDAENTGVLDSMKRFFSRKKTDTV